MIYVSSDMVYYDLYVRPLIHSIVRQIPWIHVHVHLILDQAVPTDLEAHERVTHSWEIKSYIFRTHAHVCQHRQE